MWEGINSALRHQVRLADGHKAQPSAISVDSQSVKTTAVGGERSLTAASWSKAANGHVLVDTMGNLRCEN